MFGRPNCYPATIIKKQLSFFQFEISKKIISLRILGIGSTKTRLHAVQSGISLFVLPLFPHPNRPNYLQIKHTDTIRLPDALAIQIHWKVLLLTFDCYSMFYIVFNPVTL